MARWISLTVGVALASQSASAATLDLRAVRLDLPGAPATVIATDVNGDGRRDLAVVVAVTERGELGIEELSRMEGVEGLVEVLTVVPALLDRRELHVFLAGEAGAYQHLAEPLVLPASVLALEAGPPGLPLVALTDDGAAAVRLGAEGRLSLEALLADPPILAGAGAFLPRLQLLADADGDGLRDLLLPVPEGTAVYLAAAGGLATTASSRPRLPFDARLPGKAFQYERGFVRHFPIPAVADINGDGKPDLLVRDHLKGWNEFQVLLGEGGGHFRAPFSPLAGRSRDAEPAFVYVGDLDGDGKAELVSEEKPPDNDDAGLRESLNSAKRPRFRYRVHRLKPDLTLDPEPRQSFEAEGYAINSGDEEIPVPGGFQDLNGDGRLDLIAVALDFSLMQAVKVLTVKRITIGLDFNLYCQQKDGSFRPVPGLDLAGEFKLDLNNVRVHQLSLFNGDFDGDGNADFVQLGRGKVVSIHRGRDDCSYPSKPDLTLTLREAPPDLALVRVEDFDGDGRSDLMFTIPKGSEEGETTSSVGLDLYLSGGVR